MEKEKLCYFTKYLAKKGLIEGSEGNLSVRDKYGFWITPSGVLKELIGVKELAFVSYNGEFLKGKPSSEWGMHLRIYKKNPEINAVVHTHSTYTILLSEIGFDFRKFTLKEAEFILKKIAVMPYFDPGSEALWEFASNLARNYKVIVLRGHGVVTTGKDLEEAVILNLVLEKLAKIEFLLNFINTLK